MSHILIIQLQVCLILIFYEHFTDNTSAVERKKQGYHIRKRGEDSGGTEKWGRGDIYNTEQKENKNKSKRGTKIKHVFL